MKGTHATSQCCRRTLEPPLTQYTDVPTAQSAPSLRDDPPQSAPLICRPLVENPPQNPWRCQTKPSMGRPAAATNRLDEDARSCSFDTPSSHECTHEHVLPRVDCKMTHATEPRSFAHLHDPFHEHGPEAGARTRRSQGERSSLDIG